MKPVEIDWEAALEIEEAADYYGSRNPAAERDFRKEIKRAIARIDATPTAFALHHLRFRKFLLRRFPYAVYFTEFDDYVWIAAVCHAKQKPNYWVHRRPS